MAKLTSRFITPTVFVLFGVTGDLVKTKILPSLFSLYVKNLLPEKLQIYGFSRRDLNNQSLRDYFRGILVDAKAGSEKDYDRFLKYFFYARGNFEDKDAYKNLAATLGKTDKGWQFCSNKLLYLAVAPKNYKTILLGLKHSGLTAPCGAKDGMIRIAIEKPFGSDLKTAEELDMLLGKLFTEEQIYRVDHYLGKETVRNIIAFRFSNLFLTPAWNNKYIEKIEFILHEAEDIESRGEFYDGVGALRDVGQNHLLQLLALFTMDNPGSFTAEAIRKKRAETLARLEIFDSEGVASNTLRAQYKGYRSQSHVDPASNTETYFKIKATMHSGPFTGVPLYIESGKGLAETRTEIKITFKHFLPCLCPPGGHFQNVLRYNIKPDENIKVGFLAKKPGHDYILSQVDFGFDYAAADKQDFVADYEQLLLDIVKGDQTLFISTAEITAEWRFVEAIIKGWGKNKTDLKKYQIGSKTNFVLPADNLKPQSKAIGIIGLGKMGHNFALQLMEKGWRVAGYNRSPEKTQELAAAGMVASYSLAEFVSKLSNPKIVWLMLPAGEVVDQTLFDKGGLVDYLQPGAIVLDAGNSYYKDTIRRGKKLAKLGIKFADVGFSGGPGGARNGACFMVGGDRKLYDELLPLYIDGATAGGVEHFQGLGAGHFVKMVHNGIEYGMMQAIGEGFAIMKKAPFKLDLTKVAKI
ncbi:MAG: glucose-6-phosphate dehydrogenase, partial [Patescibacteria group bacterium]